MQVVFFLVCLGVESQWIHKQNTVGKLRKRRQTGCKTQRTREFPETVFLQLQKMSQLFLSPLSVWSSVIYCVHCLYTSFYDISHRDNYHGLHLRQQPSCKIIVPLSSAFHLPYQRRLLISRGKKTTFYLMVCKPTVFFLNVLGVYMFVYVYVCACVCVCLFV